MRKNLIHSFIAASLLAFVFFSCSKSDSGGTTPPPNPCAGVTVTVTATVVDANSGQSNGSITATAAGGSGFTFKLGNGSFQSTGAFTNLAAGSYTVTAKSASGCEGTVSFTVGTINPCNGVNITVSAVTTNATPCASPNNGTVTVTASGSTGLTYSINGINFQSSNVFSTVAAGNYTVTVKDANGCLKTAAATVAANAAGTLFAAVKAVIQANCISCHSGAAAAGGRDWTVDCNVVANGALIKTRAVDQAGTATQMPQGGPALSAADQKKITDWINAGGKYTD